MKKLSIVMCVVASIFLGVIGISGYAEGESSSSFPVGNGSFYTFMTEEFPTYRIENGSHGVYLLNVSDDRPDIKHFRHNGPSVAMINESIIGRNRSRYVQTVYHSFWTEQFFSGSEFVAFMIKPHRCNDIQPYEKKTKCNLDEEPLQIEATVVPLLEHHNYTEWSSCRVAGMKANDERGGHDVQYEITLEPSGCVVPDILHSSAKRYFASGNDIPNVKINRVWPLKLNQYGWYSVTDPAFAHDFFVWEDGEIVNKGFLILITVKGGGGLPETSTGIEVEFAGSAILVRDGPDDIAVQ